MTDLKDKLKKIASAQRVNLTDEELDQFARQAKDVLAAFDTLDRIDTKNVEPAFHPVLITTAFREDAPETSSAPTANIAKQEKGYLVGPRMMK